jgi:hypothetical protein
MRREQALVTIGGITIIALFFMGLYAAYLKLGFFRDALIGIAGTLLLYKYRDKIVLSVPGAAFLSLGILMNVSGVFGFYDEAFFGIGWDKYLHMTSCVALTLLTYAYLQHTKKASFLELGIMTFIIVQGFGAINEVAEYIGSYYFGIGQGLFGLQNGIISSNSVLERYDTNWDLLFNTMAMSVALLGIAARRYAERIFAQKRVIKRRTPAPAAMRAQP